MIPCFAEDTFATLRARILEEIPLTQQFDLFAKGVLLPDGATLKSHGIRAERPVTLVELNSLSGAFSSLVIPSAARSPRW